MTKVVLYKTNANKRRVRTRSKLFGTSSTPRLSVFRSNKYISAQLIDDAKGVTLAFVSSKGLKTGTKIEQSKQVGTKLAGFAKEKGVKKAIFDRGSYKFHGRVKALAEGAKEAGLEI